MTTLAPAEVQRLEVLESVIDAGMQTFVHVGNALLEIRDARLYRATHATFEDYCQARWRFNSSRARQLIAAAEVAGNLQSVTTVTLLPATESQARPLTTLPPEAQREVWQQAVATAPAGRVTAAHVQQVVSAYRAPRVSYQPDPEYQEYARLAAEEGPAASDDTEHFVNYEVTAPVVPIPAPTPRPHVTNNSGNNEWYTPAEYIAAARSVLGAIDLDPASSDDANTIVRATVYYTADNDGLAQVWRGRVWMNPPYSGDLIGLFAAKLAEHVNAGQVSAAIVLVNNATETGWFQELIAVASAVVFPRSRIRYLQPNGLPAATGLQGQAFIYIGRDPQRFIAQFSRFGWGALIA